MGRSLDHSNFIFPQGYLFGLTLSTAGSSTTFTVAAGEAVDVAFGGLMTLGSSLSKTTSAWAVGAAAGSLDTGSIAANTWYCVFLIKRPDTGVVDVLTSLSATSPTMPSNYTLKRRIGAMKTNGSSQWTSFTQSGDEFLWALPVVDVSNTSISTSLLTPTLSVAPGIPVNALFHAIYSNTSATTSVLFYSPQTSTQTIGGGNSSLFVQVASQFSAGDFNIRTNTTQQINAVGSAANGTYYITTQGWVDTRGKLF